MIARISRRSMYIRGCRELARLWFHNEIKYYNRPYATQMIPQLTRYLYGLSTVPLPISDQDVDVNLIHIPGKTIFMGRQVLLPSKFWMPSLFWQSCSRNPHMRCIVECFTSLEHIIQLTVDYVVHHLLKHDIFINIGFNITNKEILFATRLDTKSSQPTLE